MHFPRTLAAVLGLTALSAASLFSPAPARAQTSYTVTDLNPAGLDGSQAAAVSGNTQVGTAALGAGYGDAVLWTGSAASLVDLTPPGYDSSVGLGVSGDTQVGRAFNANNNSFVNHAFLWHSTAASGVDLTPAGFSESRAYAASDDTQVGEAGDQAFLWRGTAQSAVSLAPAGYTLSYAFGAGGGTQVGMAYVSAHVHRYHAVLWHGTARSVVDLHPAGFDGSEALGTDGSTQVGDGYTFNSASERQPGHALLWHGTAGSAVDLQPNGYYDTVAAAVSGHTQVGYGGIPDTNQGLHALVWHDTAASAIDLTQFLPADLRGASQAFGVLPNGDIVGYGTSTAGAEHAVIWHPVPVTPRKPVLFSLLPGSRTAGRSAFTLTVIGSYFLRSSVILWNGMAQATTHVSGTQLTAQIPAALIAQVGTARVAVSIPGVGVSNSRTETIMARPVLSSLSPKSKTAGSSAFTLTVTGANFRPASFYAPTVVKWNDTALATTYVSPTKLTAQVPASLLTTAGTVTVMVTTPEVATSAGKAFTITL